MKKYTISAALLLAAAAGTAHAEDGQGQGNQGGGPNRASVNSSNAKGQVIAKVVATIKLTHVSGAVLDFGTFTAGTGGTVTVTAAGVGSTTGDVGFAPLSTNAADSFTVKGDPNRSFAIATQSGTVTGVVSNSTMAFTTVPSATSAVLSVAGASAFTVGGTLTVASGQAADTYNGTYNATVTYN